MKDKNYPLRSTSSDEIQLIAKFNGIDKELTEKECDRIAKMYKKELDYLIGGYWSEMLLNSIKRVLDE